MTPITEKLHWVASEATACALAKKITAINKHAWDLLSRLEEDQVIDLIMMIEESIENFSSLVNIKPEYGKVSSLDLFKGFYSKMTLYIDDEGFDDYNVPEDLDVLQVFAALSASKASYALEFLAGRNITTVHLEKFGSVEAASTALASDAAIEAAETLVVGYAEFKRMHEYFTAEEHEEQRKENFQIRATKGGAAKSSKYRPLREKAFQLYDDLVTKDDVLYGHFTAATIIQPELLVYAVENGFIKDAEATKENRLKADRYTPETICRWLSGAKKKQEWREILDSVRELDEDSLDS